MSVPSAPVAREPCCGSGSVFVFVFDLGFNDHVGSAAISDDRRGYRSQAQTAEEQRRNLAGNR